MKHTFFGQKLVFGSILLFALMIFSGAGYVQAQQDRAARNLADKVAAAFSNHVGSLDRANLLRGRLKVSIQNWIVPDDSFPEFQSRTFKNFTAMERWLKSEENQPGFPRRTSGMGLSCRSGLCRLDLKDGQMMHNHVYLTRIWYGYSKGSIYIKRIKLLYG